MLEAADADVAYREGRFEVVGTDRRVSLSRSRRMQGKRATRSTPRQPSTPADVSQRCHVAEVEIDPDTGATEIVSYAAVDDAASCSITLSWRASWSRLAQGIGQALMETAIYDEGNVSS